VAFCTVGEKKIEQWHWLTVGEDTGRSGGIVGERRCWCKERRQAAGWVADGVVEKRATPL
jgi:hypothetical protein